MKLKQVMFFKTLMKIKNCLILVITQKIQSFLILSIKKVIDKIKDELKRNIISEFVGLKSKMYTLIDVDNEGNKKTKGLNKNVVKA